MQCRLYSAMRASAVRGALARISFLNDMHGLGGSKECNQMHSHVESHWPDLTRHRETANAGTGHGPVKTKASVEKEIEEGVRGNNVAPAR